MKPIALLLIVLGGLTVYWANMPSFRAKSTLATATPSEGGGTGGGGGGGW